MNRKTVLLIASFGILALAMAATYYYVNKNNTSNPESTTANETSELQAKVTVNGELSSKETEQMATDQPGVFKIKTADGTVTVHVDAGESACDSKAIKLPVSLSVGDQTEARGMRGPDDIIRVCETGTYIKQI